mmetsp:Transcript_166191/g.319203  ORF Transcript_166191/g.319203 Transcript_166191/m.319203 type:complete len:279 (+) Transcript_166191:79-915(+)
MASVLDPVALLCRGAASAPSDQSQPAVHPSSLYHAALAGALLQQALQPMAWPAAVPTGLHHPPGLSQPGLAQPALLQQPPGLQEARGFGELAASSVPMPAIGEDCRAAGVQQGTPIQAWALESKLKAQQAQASQRHWAEKMQQQYVKGQEVLDVVQRRAEENIPKVQQLDDPAKANGGAFERLVSLMGAPGTPERRSDVSCSEDEAWTPSKSNAQDGDGTDTPPKVQTKPSRKENASSECASWEIRKQHSGERTPTSRRSRQRGRRGYAPSQVAGAFQ